MFPRFLRDDDLSELNRWTPEFDYDFSMTFLRLRYVGRAVIGLYTEEDVGCQGCLWVRW
jgi:hypothetical protein